MFIPSLFKLACFIENIPLLCHVFVSSSSTVPPYQFLVPGLLVIMSMNKWPKN